MRTIVIGGAGFIGSVVTHSLIITGRDVTVVGRRPEGSFAFSMACRYRCADLGNRAQMRELLEPGCEVIDLAYATVPKTSYGDPAFDLLANLPGSVALLEEVISMRIKRLLLVSSGGTVYGQPLQLPIPETHPTAPLSPYGITKLTIDYYALMFHRTRDLPVVVVRPGNAYGIQQRSRTGQGFLAAAIDAILSRRPIEIYGAEGTIRDYIHVSDLAAGIVAALDAGSDGEIYNIGTGIGSSNLDVIDLLRPHALASGHPLHVHHLPARRFDVEANVLDSRKLSGISDWKPRVSLEDGVAEVWGHALTVASSL